jgi:hypothetical protein
MEKALLLVLWLKQMKKMNSAQAKSNQIKKPSRSYPRDGFLAL